MQEQVVSSTPEIIRTPMSNPRTIRKYEVIIDRENVLDVVIALRHVLITSVLPHSNMKLLRHLRVISSFITHQNPALETPATNASKYVNRCALRCVLAQNTKVSATCAGPRT